MTETSAFNTADLDALIHSKIRLGIMAYLAKSESARFSDIREAVGASDGNLSTHLKRLEAGGYVELEKNFTDGKPQTTLHITPEGREAWHNWVADILALMKVAV